MMVRYYVAGGKLISQALEPEILAKTLSIVTWKEWDIRRRRDEDNALAEVGLC